MFSGIQELLVLIIIILLIFFIPRVLSRQQPAQSSRPPVHRRAGLRLAGRLRVAIVASIAWPLVLAPILQPWQSNKLNVYLYLAIGPVLLGWAIAWVILGFKKRP
jgi:hypothetical protein